MARGGLFQLSRGSPHAFCLLAGLSGFFDHLLIYLQSFFFPTPPSHGLVMGIGKYSTDWISETVPGWWPLAGLRWISPSLARIVARLHQPLRLPSSSIVDEFNTSFSVNLNFFQNIELIKNDIYFNEFSFKTKPTTCVLNRWSYIFWEQVANDSPTFDLPQHVL